MKTRAPAPKPSHVSPSPARARGPFFGKHGGGATVTAAPTSLQRSVVTGRRGDAHEREADAMADMVTGRTPATGPPRAGVVDRISPVVQRRADRDAEPGIQARADTDEEHEPVQALAGREEEPPVQAQTEEPEDDRPVQAQAEEQEDESPVQARVEEQKDDEPVQAQVAEEQEEEPPVQAQAEEPEIDRPIQAQAEEPDRIQAQADGGVATATPHAVRDQLRARRGRGRPLPDGVRAGMEIRFGADFSGVRIHTDDPAIQMTRLLDAVAFTQGRDVYFNAGRFAPGTRAGDHLLAHELTHTIQQGAAGSRPRALRPEPGAVQRQEDRQSTVLVRPELLQAIRMARGEIGKVNAKKTNTDGTRLGWERLREYFLTAFGQKEVVHQDIIKFIRKVKDQHGKDKDVMPSWCGIFVWWAYKSAGIPIPDWKLGASILGWVTPRKAGELPRKGDIAYRELNQHFAMVTGVEDPASTAGKDFRNVRVATINGNTSGEDNLGGQVEEKWEPIGRWLAFFDPVAKLDMPPAALVETGVAPDAAEAAETRAEAGATAPAPAPVEAGAPTDVSDLDEAVTSKEEDPADADASIPIDMPEPAPIPPEGEVELPPAPGVPPPEPVAVVEPLPLEGPADQAMVGFIDASPSQMAATAPGLAPALDGKLHQEQKTEVENAPVLVARTTGKSADAGLTPADQISAPPDTTIGDGVTAPGSEDLQATPHENVGEPPANTVIEEEMEDQDEGGFFGWLRRIFPNLLERIRTTDPGVNTSAGPRPKVDLSEEANPNEMRKRRAEAQTDLVGQRDRTTEDFRGHPGQQKIQPVAVEERKPVALSPETAAKPEAAPAQGVTDYAEARLPAEVRTRADELLGPKLDADLTQARAQTEQAAQERDTDKATEIAHAEDEAARINRDADKDQRDIVVKSRGEVARQQAEGIADAYGKVNEFNRAADTEQTAARKEIGTKVTESEGDARRQMDEAEAKARKTKEDKEKEAAAKKKELEKAEEDDSWWDRAVSAVKSAVRAISNAIKKVFNELRAFVKNLIDKVKNAVIGLINRARNWIVNRLNDFRDWAKEQVTKYLGDAFPALARRINAAIDTAVDGAIDGVNFVADTAIAAVEKLANALAKALDKILQVFQIALTAAVGIAGAIITGDFAEALRIAIQAVCDIVGIDSQPVFDFIDRAASALITILKDPGTFFNNLMSAVGGGVRSFAKNIKEHLINGLIGWLTGALSEVAIKLPETFDFKGMFSLVAQILGLTYENIKAKVIKRFPPAATVFDVIKKSFAIVGRLVDEGPVALWEEAQQALSNLKDIVLGGIRNYVITTVVKEAIVWLLSLLNPAAALVKLIKLIFDLVRFLIERFEQIKDFVVSVYDSLAAIASGALEQATKAVEAALARSLPIVIGLLATLAGLGGIGKTVKGIISKISTPVHQVVDGIISRIVAFAKKLLKKGKAAAGKVKEKVLALIRWWTKKKTFEDATGAAHEVYYVGDAKNATLHVASFDPRQLDTFFKEKSKEAGQKGASFTKKHVSDAKTHYDEKVTPLEQKLRQVDKIYSGGPGAAKLSAEKKTKGVDENKKLVDNLEQALAVLTDKHLKRLFGSTADDYPPPKLPVMADNKKASSFTADYIVSGPKYKVKTGTESGSHVGNLEGWPALQAAKLTHQSQWVRMHLLPHRLGGNAVDSNLTPARGPKSNIPFSSAVEQPAIEAAVEGPAKQRKPIWYAFSIDYYTGASSPFPKYLDASWGFYDKTAEGFVRGKAVGRKPPQHPKEPEFTEVVPNLNDPDVGVGEIAAVANVDRGFAELVLNLRNETANKSLGVLASSVKRKMEKRYVEVDAKGKRHYRFGVEKFDARLGLVITAIDNGKITLK